MYRLKVETSMLWNCTKTKQKERREREFIIYTQKSLIADFISNDILYKLYMPKNGGMIAWPTDWPDTNTFECEIVEIIEFDKMVDNTFYLDGKEVLTLASMG